MKSQNLFKTLSKYGSREEENYLTESLVFLIKLLLERTPSVGLVFVNKLCGVNETLHFEHLQAMTISTQVSVDEGRPDIEIKSGINHLTYIEVKHDAPLSPGQLECYMCKLLESGFKDTQLVLLSRSLLSAQETTLERNEYHHICWYDIHRWLSNIIEENEDKVCAYVIQEFLYFLESKHMSLEQVTWEYMNGVPALVAIGNLLEVAILEAIPGVKLKKSGGWHWRGFYLEESFFCGVRYDNPLIISFENNNGTNPTYKRDLDLKKVHFFSLDQAEQLECMIQFVQESKSGTTETN